MWMREPVSTGTVNFIVFFSDHFIDLPDALPLLLQDLPGSPLFQCY